MYVAREDKHRECERLIRVGEREGKGGILRIQHYGHKRHWGWGVSDIWDQETRQSGEGLSWEKEEVGEEKKKGRMFRGGEEATHNTGKGTQSGEHTCPSHFPPLPLLGLLFTCAFLIPHLLGGDSEPSHNGRCSLLPPIDNGHSLQLYSICQTTYQSISQIGASFQGNSE